MSTDGQTDELRADAEEVREDLEETAEGVKARAKVAGRRVVEKARENKPSTTQGTVVLTGTAATALAVWAWRRRRAARPPTRMELAAQTAVLVRDKAAELGVAAVNSDAAGRAREIASTPENTRRAQGAAAAMVLMLLVKLLFRRRS
jgi:hypothetical protein